MDGGPILHHGVGGEGEGVRHTSNYRGSTQFYFSLLFDFNSNFQMALQANENPYPRGLL